MQRESFIQSQPERELTQDLANQLGQALEDVSRATGAVAHLYKSLKMGANGAAATVEANSNLPTFQNIIDETGSVRSVA